MSFEQTGTIEVRNSESRQDAEVAPRDVAGFCYKEKKLPQHKRLEIDPTPVHPLAPLFSVLFFMARIKFYFLL